MSPITLPRVRFWLLAALLFAAPLSLHPSISLPLFNFPTFRVGLYQLLAVVFVLCALPLVISVVRQLWRQTWATVGSAALAAALLWGAVTTTNLPRTALYSASLLALIMLGAAGYAVYQSLSLKQRDTLPIVLLWSGLIFGTLALLELLLVTLGVVPPAALCSGCVSSVFGFPRVNLTAAEPQFLANSLLPALFASLFFVHPTRTWLAPLTTLIVSAAIAVTFSRGAYLALVVGLGVYLAVLIYRRNFEQMRVALKSTVTIAVGLLGGFLFLIGSASYLYRDSPYIMYDTAVSALSHVTLGLINFPESNSLTTVQPEPTTETAPPAAFDPEGFVSASSNDRLNAAQTALSAWNDTPLSVLFGVGMGNLGGYVRSHAIPNAPADLTVYIFYVLLLAELGIVGLALLLTVMVTIVWRSLPRLQQPWFAFAGTLTVAFAVQLTFFGSYINVMYLYLFLGLFLALPGHTKPRIIKAAHAK